MKQFLAAITCMLTFSLTGCAYLDSTPHRFNVQSGESLSVNMTQRVVVSQKVNDRTIVCAEPSPDALTSTAVSLGAKANLAGDKALDLALSSAVNSAYAGLRTQTIQLLRDGMYRLCESYLGGAISHEEFNRLQRRYQNSMMGLLAIEQLTGVVATKPVVLISQGAATGGGSAAVSTSDLAKAIDKRKAAEAALADPAVDKAIADQKAKVKTAKDALDAESDTTKKPPLQVALDAENKSLKAAEDNKKALEAAASSAKSSEEAVKVAVQASVAAVTANSGGSYAIGTSPGSGHLPTESVSKIADTVKDIVNNIVLKSFLNEECLEKISSGKLSDDSTLAFCRVQLVNSTVKELEAAGFQKSDIEMFKSQQIKSISGAAPATK